MFFFAVFLQKKKLIRLINYIYIIFFLINFHVLSKCDAHAFLLKIISSTWPETQTRTEYSYGARCRNKSTRPDRPTNSRYTSRCEWRSNLRTMLSLLDEHDERHRPSIQGIDIRPLATSACHSRRASYTERNGPIYSEGCRFWLLSADVTDPPPSPRDTNLSVYPHGEARWSAPSLHLSLPLSLFLPLALQAMW